MIAASHRNATRRNAALRPAPQRSATRLWAAWNRFGDSGMPKGINLASPRSAAQRSTSRRAAAHRNANLEGTRYDPD